MRKLILILILVMLAPFSVSVMAASFQGTFMFTDTTPTGPNYTPSYSVEIMAPDSTVTLHEGLSTPSYTIVVPDIPGQTYQARGKTINTQGPIESAWSPWISAITGAIPTTPDNPSGFSFTFTYVP